ncbi:TetR/AcrR family transcriptional regulator [Tessaracoccus caeni]|uniref:TetR/AcrR family transcriptional regulator n=1 Tax=Tessaracoccus caeni TaxID=3031239 RepID=UPI0023DCAD76|nr:TetR/AcrR family transcriptional regulator [Tessaracoccus caeni]MDF1487276.1 TetR/AcrR family transcriptional regulator [Tessaracoccus caeni]
MTRAAPLPREQRRAAIVEATIPLLREHGHSLTSRQIAEAAGIAEGTVFRAFDSLDDVLQATVMEVLSPDRLRRTMAAARFTGELRDDCLAAVELMSSYVNTVKTLIHLGHSRGDHVIMRCARDEMTQRQGELFAFLESKFAPHQAELALAPGQFAKLLELLTVGLETQFTPQIVAISRDELIDFALNGALRKETL